MTDHVRKIVDSIKRLLKLRNEKNKPMPDHILITAQSLFDLTDELERTEREKDAAQAELVQIKLKHGDEEGIVSAAYLFQKAEQEARAFMRRQQEAAAPKWISVEERLPERHGQACVGLYSQHGDDKPYPFPHVFAWHAYGDNGYVNGPHFSDEGLDGLKVHYWMPLPEVPKEELNEEKQAED